MRTIDLGTRRVVTIGRSPRCDLALPAESVSRRHAVLFRHADGWRIVDSGSRHGLQSEAGPRTAMELDARTWCRVGGVHLWLEPSGRAPVVPQLSDLPDPEDEWLQMEPDREPGPVLSLLNERDRPLRRVALREHDGLLVGSSATSDVVVQDPKVPPLAALFYREQTRWCVVDAAGEPPGILLDGRRAPRHRLHGGAVIGLGGHRLVVSGPLPRPGEFEESDPVEHALHREADGGGDLNEGTSAPDGGPLSAFLPE